jgi:hypothetical protein
LPAADEVTPVPSSVPETTVSPVSDKVAETDKSRDITAAPTVAPIPASVAQKEEVPPPFTFGYAWAPEDTRLYTERSQSEDALLVQLPYSVHLYVKDCRGNWAELIVAPRTEEGVQVMEAYVPLYYLELIGADDQADAAASVFGKAHTDHHGTMIRIISLVDVETKDTAEPAEESVPEITEVPAEEPVSETTETPAPETAPEITAEPTSAPTPAPSVSIRIQAGPVRIGDSVTLEAVTEGFDHEPVFLWEFRLPDGDKWYPCEEESSRTLTFIVNRYNCGYIWRVTAE